MNDTDKWWDQYRDTLVPGYEATIEAEAKMVHRCVISSIIDGLLQTEAYARVILDGPPVVEKETLLEVRMKRQWHVFEKAMPPKLEFVMDEACLYRELGGKEVLKEQLKHLLSMSKLPMVSLRILPFSETRNSFMSDTFLYFFNEQKTEGMVQFETHYGMSGQSDHTTLVMYYNHFVNIRDRALDEAATRETIKRAIARLEMENMA